MMQPSQVQILNPGDVACVQWGDRLETLLGSCVAVVLTDPRRTIGAMCHIVHVSPSARQQEKAGADAAGAFAGMFKLLRERGIDPKQCVAYVYGGGNLFPDVPTNLDVGQRNAAWVLDELNRCGIQVLEQNLGGFAYRRLRWTVGPAPPEVTVVSVSNDAPVS